MHSSQAARITGVYFEVCCY